MKIAFISLTATDASPVVRAKWPCAWVNKFTAHSAFLLTQRDIHTEDAWTQFRTCDVVVFHKQGKEQVRVAEKLRKMYPHITLVFDSDDFDPLVWDYYRIEHYMLHSFEHWDRMLELCDGFTLASKTLADKFTEYGKPIAHIDNGYDLTLSANTGRTHDYYSARNPDLAFQKVVYAGGDNHYPELGKLLDWGVMERIADEYNVDFKLYGMFKSARSGQLVVRRKRGGIYGDGGASIDKYIELLFHDSAFNLAPLIEHPFNTYRSPIKCIEAGVAQKTIICSDVPAYQAYAGQDCITRVPNDGDAWYEAIKWHVEHQEETAERGRMNRKIVEQYHDAQYLTEKRIAFYEQLMSMK